MNINKKYIGSGVAAGVLGFATFLIVKRFSKKPLQERITSDVEGHYDIDGVSLGITEVIVASDAQPHSR